MLEEDNDETCWNDLENFRVKLISVIDPSRITPYLRQCKVISHDDEEQVLNDPSLVMRKRKAGGWSAAIGSVDAPMLCQLLGADWKRVLTDWAWRRASPLWYHLPVFKHKRCRHCYATPFPSTSLWGEEEWRWLYQCIPELCNGSTESVRPLVFWMSRLA